MVNEWLSVVAVPLQITFVVLTVMGGVRSSLTLPFALMCLTFFAWNSTSLAYDLSGHPGWFFLEHAAAPFAAPLVFHLVVAFTGRLRRLRWVIVAFYAAFAVTLAVPAVLAFALPWAR